MAERRSSVYWVLALITVAAFVATVIVVRSCRMEPTPTPSPTPVPSGSVKPTPSASVVPPDDADPPADAGSPWVSVKDLNLVRGVWGSPPPGPNVRITSRATAEKWDIPFPWRLEAHGTEGDWDCGFFEHVEDGSWRVGFCKGTKITGDVRDARRIVLEVFEYVPGKLQLRVIIGSTEELILSKEPG